MHDSQAPATGVISGQHLNPCQHCRWLTWLACPWCQTAVCQDCQADSHNCAEST